MIRFASCPGGFDLFTEDKILVFIFDPFYFVPDINHA